MAIWKLSFFSSISRCTIRTLSWKNTLESCMPSQISSGFRRPAAYSIGELVS